MPWEHAYYTGGSAFLAEGYSDTDTVTTWPDEIGSLDLTIGTNKPTFNAVDASLNGQPCVAFDGTDIIQSAAGAGIAQPFSIVLIGRIVTQVTNDFFCDGLGTGSRVAFIDRGSNGYDLFAGATVRYDPGTTDNAIHAFVGVVNGASSALEVDGVLTTGDAGSNTFSGVTLGGGFDDVSFKMVTNIGFFGVYDGDVRDDPNWGDFETWVTETYGLWGGGG